LVNKILRANNNHEKEYVVTVDKPITNEFIAGMQGGVPILGQMTKKCQVVKESTFVFNITLVQGLNRQIRRMCEYFGYEVTQLVRTRIMNVSLKGLALGDWRDLTPKEIETIVALTETSDVAPEKKAPEKKKIARPNYSGGRSSAQDKKTAAKRASSGAGAGNKARKDPKAKGAAAGKRGGKGAASAGRPATKGKGRPGSHSSGRPGASKGAIKGGRPSGGKAASGKPPSRRK